MPRWSADGERLYYLSEGGVVDVEVGLAPSGKLFARPERRLFDLAAAGVSESSGWSLSPEGKGFIFVKPLGADVKERLVVRRHALQH